MMRQDAPLQCPACRARFRGETTCSRCGADLHRPMLLVLSATRLRNAARAAIEHHDYTRAGELAEIAQQHHPTRTGHGLHLLAQWLDALIRR
jgi:hypothetical protein